MCCVVLCGLIVVSLVINHLAVLWEVADHVVHHPGARDGILYDYRYNHKVDATLDPRAAGDLSDEDDHLDLVLWRRE